MTPQERQLVIELFDRLQTLEGAQRDPDAENAIVDGFDRAPNAAYGLVQTVLVQDEALKRANARIEELEAALRGEPQPSEQSGGFLDSMRDSMFGRGSGRGSVPSVRPDTPGPGMGSSGVWNTRAPAETGWGSRPDYPPNAPPATSGGGSFLGTAAAGAAGVIGGALLLNSIRSMFGSSHAGTASTAFDPGLSGGGERAPWSGGGSTGDLAREAGLDDISGSRSAGRDDTERHAGLFGSDDDQASDDDGDFDDDFGGDFDDGGSDTA